MNKLEKGLITAGIALSSLIPLKSLGQNQTQNQNYYAKLGLSGKILSNSNIQHYFKTIPGGKFSMGFQPGNLSRIELEAAHYRKKNKKEKLKTNMTQFGGYYDLCVGKEKGFFYLGAGVKIMNFNFEDMEYNHKEGMTGIGFGLRGGIEIKTSENEVMYLELNYDEISGKYDGEDYDLSGTEITFGGRFKF